MNETNDAFNEEFFQKEEEFDPKSLDYKYLHSDNLETGTIKLSHIPDGFYEKEMLSYFSQFGEVTRLNLVRSRKTGRSKGFAYIEFACDEVANIVASTMNNYLMFEKLMKCTVVPKEFITNKLFAGYKPGQFLIFEKYRKIFNNERNHEEVGRQMARKLRTLNKNKKALNSLGIDFDFDFVKPKFPKQTENKKQKKNLKPLRTILNRTSISNISESSTHTLEVDSSEDEITFKTPPRARKIAKVKNQQFGEDKSKQELPLTSTNQKRKDRLETEALTSSARNMLNQNKRKLKAIEEIHVSPDSQDSSPKLQSPFGFKVTPLEKMSPSFIEQTSRRKQKKGHEVNEKLNGFKTSSLQKKNKSQSKGFVAQCSSNFKVSRLNKEVSSNKSLIL